MTRRLRIFLRLPSEDRVRLVEAAFVIGAIRLGLWLLPFRAVRRFVTKTTRSGAGPWRPCGGTVDRVAWAVAAAGRRMPWVATCLTQAMAAQVLLGRQGETSELRFGVAKDDGGQLQAHAWLESDGRIIIGGEGDLSEFTPLPIRETRLR